MTFPQLQLSHLSTSDPYLIHRDKDPACSSTSYAKSTVQVRIPLIYRSKALPAVISSDIDIAAGYNISNLAGSLSSTGNSVDTYGIFFCHGHQPQGRNIRFQRVSFRHKEKGELQEPSF